MKTWRNEKLLVLNDESWAAVDLYYRAGQINFFNSISFLFENEKRNWELIEIEWLRRPFRNMKRKNDFSMEERWVSEPEETKWNEQLNEIILIMNEIVNEMELTKSEWGPGCCSLSFLHQPSINPHQHKLKKFSFVEWVGWIDECWLKKEEKAAPINLFIPALASNQSLFSSLKKRRELICFGWNWR